MSERFIVDMRNFVEPPEPDGRKSRARERVRRFLGEIIEAATMATPGITTETAIRCRRRPERKPCPRTIRVQLTEVPPHVVWECAGCGDQGTITHWRGTVWDLSARRRAEREIPVEILLTADEYQGLQQIDIFDDSSQALVRGARPRRNGVLICGMREELEDLAGFVTAEASHRRRGRNRDALRSIAGKIQEQIGPLEF